jgi:hypothetical protein
MIDRSDMRDWTHMAHKHHLVQRRERERERERVRCLVAQASKQ